uniref:Uncharacterized protein n=1 Tax=Candidatus Kentrum sp. FM TaxID=2126340 RepID=A0A450TPH7_9GAMM|nr:MAG: hypothetical protein BECKFM1743A_GA0114220_105263 [Candidatus Kentron sp. FM]VFJ74239.1 MAG: hypothetical protein BECKFM1743C_GA0114222_107772 [Candidatus Kentron sp. FM]
MFFGRNHLRRSLASLFISRSEGVKKSPGHSEAGRILHLGEERNVYAILSTKGTEKHSKEKKDSSTTEILAQPSRNGCSGPLAIAIAIAIDIATRYRTSRIRSIAIANRDIDSEPVPYGNGCMKSVQEKQEIDG